MTKAAFSVLLILLFSVGVQSRVITETSADKISDGILHGRQSSSVLLLERPTKTSSTSETCDQTYGFLPCTTTVLGNIFLIAIYGYLMFLGATYLSQGSELLLQILGPGIIGGLFLPILGALPDAILILASGLSGSKETAQKQVLIGMGLLAGSTVMLLTLLWGSCVIVGRCDLSERSTAIDSQNKKGFSLTGSGITTDNMTSYAARIMVISIVPFIIVEIPLIFNLSSGGRRLGVLVALIVSVLSLLVYCLYQVFQPWIQKRKLAYVKHKYIISGILDYAQKLGIGKLFGDDGEPNKDLIKKLFLKVDLDSDGKLCHQELTALVLGIKFNEVDLDSDDAVNKIMADFDTSGDSQIDHDEFYKGISKWLREIKRSVPNKSYSVKVSDYYKKTTEEQDVLLGEHDEVVEDIASPSWTCFKAVMLLLLGTVIAAIFADPLVDAVDNFSSATSIPSFFISFIAMPLATNSSESVTAIIFASRKKRRTASLTFSEIYGAVTMNNILCLAVFLALVYVRQLTWDFSAEVLVIIIVVIVMGIFPSFRRTFQVWTCIIAFLLYPLSLVLVYVLDYVLGWS